MIAYLDSSVLLRPILGEHQVLPELVLIRHSIASAMVEVECLRTIDRWRLLEGVPEQEATRRREAVYRALESVDLLYPTRAVLDRAAAPMPTALATLDAVHLATALTWQEHSGKRLVMATHDAALGAAARAHGMKVVGVA